MTEDLEKFRRNQIRRKSFSEAAFIRELQPLVSKYFNLTVEVLEIVHFVLPLDFKHFNLIGCSNKKKKKKEKSSWLEF